MAKKKKVTTVTTTVTKTEYVSTNEKTHIICVLDSSGSMSNIMSDSIGGFNTFLKQQRELPDEATITVALFDSYNNYQILYDNVDIKKAKDLTSKEWYPRGMTALYDAIGKTINADKARLARLGNEAPAKVLVCVVTDGQENDSKEYTIQNIKDLIRDCEKEDWNFIYLAANQDAFEVGSGFGISFGNTYTYTASAAGVANMSMTLNNASVNYRAMSSNDADFKVKSKSLIDDGKNDDDEPQDGGSITLGNTTGNFVSNDTITLDNS
jgi:uncharacterized protein YegL